MPRVVPALTAITIVVCLSGVVRSQDAGQASAKPVAPAPTPLPIPAAAKIDITLTRSNGSRTISNLPYSLYAAQGSRASLRLGSQVPIVTPGNINYQDVGSNIDCDLVLLADGRYRVNLTLDDSSLSENATANNPAVPPLIRSYRITTMLVLRNGETTTFNVATDKVSGDTIRAQVTVTALK
jgi:hypothetical protein